MRLIELKGVICDTVELNWMEGFQTVTKTFSGYGDELDEMYELYGDAVLETIYADHDADDGSWLYIRVEKPRIRIKDPKELTISKLTGKTSNNVPMVSVYHLMVDAKVIPYLLENMDCEINTLSKFLGGKPWSETSALYYDGTKKD